MRQTTRVRITLATALTLAVATVSWCGPGAGELSLDRSAVRDLIALALPEPVTLELAGLAAVTVRVDAPAEVLFHEGGVEASLPLRVSGVDRELHVQVRYVPGIEPLSGTVRLEPKSVVLQGQLPFELDLAAWVGTVDLPRRLDWDLDLDGGKRARVTCFVQGLTVEKDRLRLDLGLLLKP